MTKIKEFFKITETTIINSQSKDKSELDKSTEIIKSDDVKLYEQF